MFDVNHDASLLAAALRVRAAEPRETQSVFGSHDSRGDGEPLELGGGARVDADVVRSLRGKGEVNRLPRTRVREPKPEPEPELEAGAGAEPEPERAREKPHESGSHNRRENGDAPDRAPAG